MAIEVGDAIFKFLGDTTNMDAAFNSVGPKAQASFTGFNEVLDKQQAEWDGLTPKVTNFGGEVEKAGKLSAHSMREAKGEIGLIGEQFGIHLPRHVRTFVAEMPGVGEAMSAAFSATAVLFLIEALVHGTEKLSNWIGETLIFTEAMKESNKVIEQENKIFESLSKQYETAKTKLEELKGVTKDQEKAQIDLTKATLAQAEAQFTQLKASIASKTLWDKTKEGASDLANILIQRLIPSYDFQTKAEMELQAVKEKGLFVDTARIKAAKALAEENAVQAEEKRQRNIKTELAETESFKKIALASATTEADKYQITQFYENRKLELIRSLGLKEKEQVIALAAEIEAQQIEHAQKIQDTWVKMLLIVKQNQVQVLDTVSQVGIQSAVAFSPMQQAFMKGIDAAHAFGVTLRTDLVDDLERAKKAKLDFLGAGIIDPIALKQFDKNIADMQSRLDNFGKKIQDLSAKNQTTWKGLVTDLHTSADAVGSLGKMGEQTFNQLSKSMEGAIASMILASGSFGKEMEQATAQALASLASQAIVKALFYTAEGFAMLAGFMPGQASQYFQAAALMGGVGVAAGLAGHAMAGASSGGSGGGNPAQQTFGGSNTGGGVRGSVNISGVQKFADGGLVSGPTLAMVGEEQGKREAVLPLDHPDAMAKIGEAIAAAGGGGTQHHTHVNINGMISPDNLHKVIEQINHRVNRGQSRLLASDSLRVTKRSA
jgi:hypothetical protein